MAAERMQILIVVALMYPSVPHGMQSPPMDPECPFRKLHGPHKVNLLLSPRNLPPIGGPVLIQFTRRPQESPRVGSLTLLAAWVLDPTGTLHSPPGIPWGPWLSPGSLGEMHSGALGKSWGVLALLTTHWGG